LESDAIHLIVSAHFSRNYQTTFEFFTPESVILLLLLHFSLA